MFTLMLLFASVIAVTVAVPEVTSIRDAARAAGLLREMKLPARLLVNRMRPQLSRRGDAPNALEMVELICLPLLGVVPEDEDVPYALNRGIPLRECNYFAERAYENIAKRLVGQRVPLLKI